MTFISQSADAHMIGLGLSFFGWTAMFIASLVRWSALKDLRWKGVRIPAGLHTWRRGLNVSKLKELYKAEFPHGRKTMISAYLNGFGWGFFLVGIFLFLIGHR